MIEVKTKNDGAELTSIKYNDIEKLHDGINDWNRHAPVLFPIVGQLKNGEAIIENASYKMKQHGFARDSVFEEIGENSYLLKYNEETLEKYPYKFELYISYKTTDNTVTTEYKVKNIDDKKIYFGLGGHPAFKCNYRNAKLVFEQSEEEAQIYQLNNGLLKLEPENTSNFVNGNEITLDANIFDNDAIIMKDLKSNKVTLIENEKAILEFDFTDFPYLAIWSKPGANFVCIEPWFNTTDKVDSNSIFKDKENILSLEPNQEFTCSYTVKFF